MIFGIINSFKSRGVIKPSWWSDCLLAMNFDGENGSRSFIDYSPYKRKFAGASGAKIITSYKKFGSGCLQSGAYDNLGTSGGSPNGFTLTGNFTVQAWIKLPVYTTPKRYVVATFGNESTSRWGAYFDTIVGGVVKAVSNIYGTFDFPEISTSISADVWTHIAWVRVGSTVSFYANGVAQGSYTQSGTLGNSNFFAQPYSNNSQFLIDDLTIINSAIYTSNFSPPIQSRVYIGFDGWFTRAVLALGFNGANASTAMIDSSPVAVNPTNTGAIQVTSTDPAYDIGAGNFQEVSVGEHLTLGATANSALNGDCTIEFMFKRKGAPPHGESTTTPYHTIISKPINSAGGERGIGIVDADGVIGILQSTDAGVDSQNVGSAPTNLTDGNWHHVAISIGPIVRIFVDRALILCKKRLQTNNMFGGPQGWIGGPSVISGSYPQYQSGINCHLDNYIISAGNHYDGSFIPPVVYPIGSSDPYWGQTTLLLQFEGANNSTTFVDDGPDNITISAIGNAKIQSISGENYLLLDGSGDGLQVAASDAFNFGTGNFTIEFDVLFSSFPSNARYTLLDTRTSGDVVPIAIYIKHVAGQPIIIEGWFGASPDYTPQFIPHIPMVTGQRYHIAMVRDSGKFTVFLDGTPLPMTLGTESLLAAVNMNTSSSAKIGIAYDGATTPTDGKIYKFRVTKAARYVAEITLPPETMIP